MIRPRAVPLILPIVVLARIVAAGDVPIGDVASQPLAAGVSRLVKAMEQSGTPLSSELLAKLGPLLEKPDAEAIQKVLDTETRFVVTINPEERVKVARVPGRFVLRQAGYTPFLVKVLNEAGATRRLRIGSPSAGLVTAGASDGILGRSDQRDLRRTEVKGGAPDRFLQVEMAAAQPLQAELSGLEVEYAVALIYASAEGKREAVISFDLGQGTQDLGFRGEVPILFDIKPARSVSLGIKDENGRPTTAHLLIRDRAGHVYPPQLSRVAPDLFFQRKIYRADGGTVMLPPGRYQVEFGRGPEYVLKSTELEVPEMGPVHLSLKAERWIDPEQRGFRSGDHHIHAAGCAHYTEPTQGVRPEDMFLQVKGEGLNVGCVLTWGPCYDFQRNFFKPRPDPISDRGTIIKYDVEVSGFGSQAMGHVCLLNLKDQTYPGSEGTSTKGWPTWTTPVLRWAKSQGAVTGYAHSGSGLEIEPSRASSRLFEAHDKNRDGLLGRDESAGVLLPFSFADIDDDRDGSISVAELEFAHDRASEKLPNLAVPEMMGVGAMETPVSVALGACDFISAMDTPRIAEWNMWYHLLNCGFPLKVSGETDFPCMSGSRVGQGRVYVRTPGDGVDFDRWCKGLAEGRSYVSDGYAHALEFKIGEARSGDTVRRSAPGRVRVEAEVAFAREQPLAVAHGGIVPEGKRKLVGDTVNLHGPRRDGETAVGGTRKVDLVVNGKVVASREVPADGRVHALTFETDVKVSSWVALAHFPQLHTNPINVIVADRPIRASRSSARWCVEVIERLWRARGRTVAESERTDARRAFDEAAATYRRIAAESPEGS